MMARPLSARVVEDVGATMTKGMRKTLIRLAMLMVASKTKSRADGICAKNVVTHTYKRPTTS